MQISFEGELKKNIQKCYEQKFLAKAMNNSCEQVFCTQLVNESCGDKLRLKLCQGQVQLILSFQNLVKVK